MKRWTDDTETYVADAFRRCDPHATGQPDDYHRSNARAVLKYLADIGVLLPPGSARIVEAARAYERAWDRYANPSRYPDDPGNESDRILAKAYAHQALLDAVRAGAS